MSGNISAHLAKAALPARGIALLATVLVPLVTSNNLLSVHWSTGATAAGTLLGVYSVWLTLEIFRIGATFSQQQQKLIEEVHTSVMSGLKVQHGMELRRRYFEARDADNIQARDYWHFIWRFETYNFLGLSLQPNGYARVRILGSNNPPLEHDLEQLENPIYTVDVYEVLERDDLVNGRAYCTSINGRTFISNHCNEIELLPPMIEFLIAGLGPIAGGVVGQRPKNFKRLKDLADPSSGNQDQG